MQYLSPHQQSALGQHLICGVWAVALVGSLTIYQRAILANPRTVLQQHWEAVATEDLNLTIAQYSADAVLHRTDGTTPEKMYRGQAIHQAWQRFFAQYQIEHYQLVPQQVSDRSAKAAVLIKARPPKGAAVVLSFSCQVEINDQGKIIHEVWQANPGLNV